MKQAVQKKPVTNQPVIREDLLRCLESVQAGLAPRNIVEQSNCFVFRDGQVFTFNDEIACRCPTGLGKGIDGAVPADKMLEVIRRRPEEEVLLEQSDSRLYVKGTKGGRKSWLIVDQEVSLPIDNLTLPDKWTKLPEEFGDAMALVLQCASLDASRPVATCVHLHPKWVEASDDVQACRWSLATNFPDSTLIKRSSAQAVASLGMIEFALDDTWAHFRSKTGLVISCRRYPDDFPALSKDLKVEGTPVTLPKNLPDALDLAQVFSAENDQANLVRIDLKPGRLWVRAEGISGGHEEPRKVEYSGPKLSFLIAPQILIDLVKRHGECQLTADRLKVDAGAYRYVTALNPTEQVEEGSKDAV